MDSPAIDVVSAHAGGSVAAHVSGAVTGRSVSLRATVTLLPRINNVVATLTRCQGKAST